VENWMNDVLTEMRQTNRYITKKGIFDYGEEKEKPRLENLFKFNLKKFDCTLFFFFGFSSLDPIGL
jgi:hypothetical protein